MLGLGLAAFFLLPEWANRDAVNLAQGLLSGKFNYKLNFLTRDFWLPLPFILTAVWWAFRTSAQTMRPWIITLLLILFMMTPLSTPLWEHIPPLRYLQFPVKRFYAPLLLVQCMLCVTLLNAYPPNRSVRLAAALFASVHLLLIGGNYSYFPWNSSPEVTPFASLLARTNVISVPEYLPPSTDPGFMNPRTLDALRETPLIVAQTGKATTRITEWSARTITFEVDVASASTLLILHRFYLPLWHADAIATLAPRTGDGIMMVTLPHGNHLVHLTLDPLAGEHAGNLITLLSACMTALSLLVRSNRKPI